MYVHCFHPSKAARPSGLWWSLSDSGIADILVKGAWLQGPSLIFLHHCWNCLYPFLHWQVDKTSGPIRPPSINCAGLAMFWLPCAASRCETSRSPSASRPSSCPSLQCFPAPSSTGRSSTTLAFFGRWILTLLFDLFSRRNVGKQPIVCWEY